MLCTYFYPLRVDNDQYFKNLFSLVEGLQNAVRSMCH